MSSPGNAMPKRQASAGKGEALAHRAFAAISQQFPRLRLLKVAEVDAGIGITVPAQPGVSRPVWLAFDGVDALHFSVGQFWFEWHPFIAPDIVLEWSPMSDPDVFREYVGAVCGYLAGRCRVLEHYRDWQCLRYELQAPVANGWQTIRMWSKLKSVDPAGLTQRQLRNET